MRLMIDKINIVSGNPVSKDRTKVVEADYQRFCKKPYFHQLASNPYFVERILNSCWTHTIKINIRGAQIVDKSQKFDLFIDFERLPNP